MDRGTGGLEHGQETEIVNAQLLILGIHFVCEVPLEIPAEEHGLALLELIRRRALQELRAEVRPQACDFHRHFRVLDAVALRSIAQVRLLLFPQDILHTLEEDTNEVEETHLVFEGGSLVDLCRKFDMDEENHPHRNLHMNLQCYLFYLLCCGVLWCFMFVFVMPILFAH